MEASANGSSGHLVEAAGGERLPYGDMEFVIRASGESTGGSLSIIEEVNAIDAPPHLHTREDELFFVLEGDHVFTVGDTEYEAGPGDLVFVPRNTRHAQRRVIPNTGRTLTKISPAGMEGFFRDLVAAERSDGLDHETMHNITTRYGMVWVD